MRIVIALLFLVVIAAILGLMAAFIAQDRSDISDLQDRIVVLECMHAQGDAEIRHTSVGYSQQCQLRRTP